MGNLSLRDQLIQAGLAKAKTESKPERGPSNPHGKGRTPPPKANGKPAQTAKQPSKPAPPKDPDAVSLAHAYQLRAETEKREREEAQRRAQDEAQRKREQKAKVVALLQGKGLNDAQAEIAHYFQYGKKIRRIYVTADQQQALSQGQAGVAQLDGRFLLVSAEVIQQLLSLAAQHVALFVPANIGISSASDEDYDDPRYKVPDDLVW